MTRAPRSSTHSQPGRRILDARTQAPLDKITRIMTELALDHHERDALVRHLDRVSVSQLVGCEPTPHTRRRGEALIPSPHLVICLT